MSRAFLIIVARKLAALALVVVVVAGVGQFVIYPAAQRLVLAQERIAAARELRGRLDALTTGGAADPAVVRSIETARAALLLEGATPAIATANLQAIVRDAATQGTIRLGTVRALPQIERNGVALQGIRIEFSAPLDAVQKFLFELERRKPWLVLEAVDLAASPGQASRRVSDLPQIDAGLSVYAATAAESAKVTP